VVTALLSRGLIREQVTDSLAKADAALKRVWRNENDGRAVLLVVTETGLEAVGVEADSAPVAPAGTAPASSATERPDEPHSARTTACTAAVGAPAAENAPDAQPPRAGRTATQRKTREGTKQAQLIAMLRRPEGATIAQIVEALGWQPHTVRGAFAGALKPGLPPQPLSGSAFRRSRLVSKAGLLLVIGGIVARAPLFCLGPVEPVRSETRPRLQESLPWTGPRPACSAGRPILEGNQMRHLLASGRLGVLLTLWVSGARMICGPDAPEFRLR
jgi:hypothetical protein